MDKVAGTAVSQDAPQQSDVTELPVSLIDLMEQWNLETREQSLQAVYSAERRLAQLGRPVKNPTRPYREKKWQ